MQHQAGGTQLIQQLSRRPSGLLIAGACVTFTALAYIPVSEWAGVMAVFLFFPPFIVVCLF